MLPYTTSMTQDQAHKELTSLQARFVSEYPLDFNGAQAYLRASGTTNKKSAAVQASKMLKMPKVQEALEVYIEEQLGPQQKRLLENVKFWEGIRDDKLEGRYIRLADVLDLIGENNLDPEALIEEIGTLPYKEIHRNRTADRLKASESLAKYAQMFVDRRDVNISGTVQIVDDIK